MFREAQLLKRAVDSGYGFEAYDGAGNGNSPSQGSLAPFFIVLANFIIFFPIWMIVCCLPNLAF